MIDSPPLLALDYESAPSPSRATSPGQVRTHLLAWRFGEGAGRSSRMVELSIRVELCIRDYGPRRILRKEQPTIDFVPTQSPR
jgi:hypothetical protein